VEHPPDLVRLHDSALCPKLLVSELSDSLDEVTFKAGVSQLLSIQSDCVLVQPPEDIAQVSFRSIRNFPSQQPVAPQRTPLACSQILPSLAAAPRRVGLPKLDITSSELKQSPNPLLAVDNGVDCFPCFVRLLLDIDLRNRKAPEGGVHKVRLVLVDPDRI